MGKKEGMPRDMLLKAAAGMETGEFKLRSARAWTKMGTMFARAGLLRAARGAYMRAIAADSNYVPAVSNLNRLRVVGAAGVRFQVLNDAALLRQWQSALEGAALPAGAAMCHFGDASSPLPALAAALAGYRVTTVTGEALAAALRCVRAEAADDALRERLCVCDKHISWLVQRAAEDGWPAPADGGRTMDALLFDPPLPRALNVARLQSFFFATSSLLKEGGVIMPAALRLTVWAVSSDELRRLSRVGDVSSFDLSPFNALSIASKVLRTDSFHSVPLTAQASCVLPLTAEGTELKQLLQSGGEDGAPPPLQLTLPVIQSGEADALLYVMETLCADGSLCAPHAMTAPGSSNDSVVAVFPPRAVRMEEGVDAVVAVTADELGLALSFQAAEEDGKEETEEGERYHARFGTVGAFHFPMMNDLERAKAYNDAIVQLLPTAAPATAPPAPPEAAEKDGGDEEGKEEGGKDGDDAAKHEVVVLDIGTGSGLLSMMAARAGASAVVSVECLPEVAAVAREIVDKNGWAAHCRLHNMMSTDMTVGGAAGQLQEKADMLVSEVLGADPLSEGVLQTIKHAREALVKAGAPMVPCAVVVHAALCQSHCLRSRTVPAEEHALGIDLSPLRAVSKRRQGVRLVEVEHSLISEVWEACRLDFVAGDLSIGQCFDCDVHASSEGSAAFVAYWFTLYLTPSISISTAAEDSDSFRAHHWSQMLWQLEEPVDVVAGQHLRMRTTIAAKGVDFQLLE
eukprot:PLAT7085.1.p1 GENE.PLAT7085.1~~PLAT7085.1.p1  ORF type:complete len:743 (+),score=286.79 PLAT7085.1:26-2254(+)